MPSCLRLINFVLCPPGWEKDQRQNGHKFEGNNNLNLLQSGLLFVYPRPRVNKLYKYILLIINALAQGN